MTAAAALAADARAQLDAARDDGTFKTERVIASPQSARIVLADGREALNFCANNYLGLADDPRIVAAAQRGLAERGHGMASVRFICGTQDLHRTLEARIARFVGLEDAILYAAAFDANGGLFEPLFGEEDAIVSDALNHASIIDGIRLSKARRLRYAHADMDDLARQLQLARDGGARHVVVFSDGAFSMDGTIAPLPAMRALCDRFGALLAIDECHATGVLGAGGRGTHEHHGLLRDGVAGVDLITGTFGKALGGASGGFTAGPRDVIELLRQRSRPYLFSNALAPSITAAAIEAIDLLEADPSRLATLHANTARFRAAMAAAGLRIRPGTHPIVPVMTGDARVAQQLAQRLLELGIYVIGFFFPVVPRGEARVRVQLSAAHDDDDLDRAVAAFTQAGRELGLLA